MKDKLLLRDLVYFDFDKAASIFSQVEGGLLREIQSGVEATKDERSVRKYDLMLFKPEFGGIATEKKSQLETRVLHHDLLIRIEKNLFELGVAVDLNIALNESDFTAELIRSNLIGASYVRADGWAVIEDYERVKKIAGNFNAIAEFIGRCAMQSIEQTEEYKKLQEQLDNARAEANAEKDRNKKTKMLSNVESLESKFRKLIRERVKAEGVPEWLINGIGLFIDTFMPGRINLRVYPFESVPDFQVLANLKKDCFVDGDLENVLFAYGTRPNIKLTILGLITSLPDQFGHPFDPIEEFKEHVVTHTTEEKAFEKGFRELFDAIEKFERFMRFSRYPNITVYPLAVYRTIRGDGK